MNDLFARLEHEMDLMNSLHQHGCRLDPGRTTAADVRAAILGAGLEVVLAGVDDRGKCLTYTQMFERVYREPLIPKPARGRKRTSRTEESPADV